MIAAQPLLVEQLSPGGACAVLQLNRGSAYRWAKGDATPLRGRPPVSDPALFTAVEEIVLAYLAYGRPRVTMELRRQ